MRSLTGAEPGEDRRVLYCFLALFFLLLSYYIIKPLRTSQFFKEFDATYLPLIYLLVPILSLIITKIFNFLADRVDKYRLVIYTYLLIMGCKVAFTWLLLYAGKPAVVIFYYFASVYFLLAIATLWGCINDIFTVDQSARCFGFVALGSTLGNIVGSKFSGWLSSTAYRDYATIFSALSMGLALYLVLLAAQKRRRVRALEEEKRKSQEDAQTVSKPPFWNDVQELIRRPFVRRIAIMVFILAVFTTSLDFVSQRALDEGLSEQQFRQTFSDFPEESFQRIYPLKLSDEVTRLQILTELAAELDLPIEELSVRYAEYRTQLEASTRETFSNIYFYQGLLGVFLLLVVARVLFTYFGLRYALVVLPAVALLSLAAFSIPLEVVMVELILIITGALNYSLNNAAKEVLYTSTDEETKFKHKPLIEGPAMRFGDVSASILMMSFGVLASWLGWTYVGAERLLLVVAFGLACLWLRAIYLAGREYDFERNPKKD